MSSPPKASRALAYTALVLVVIAGVAFVVNDRIGGIQVYDVYPTPSMRPTLEVGDLVVVQAVPYSSIHVGDVIVFARPDPYGGCGSEIIVHRVVNVTSEGLITQGDNRFTNQYPDEGPPYYEWPPVQANCVRGMVVVALPYLGDISEAFPPPFNYALVAAMIFLIFAMELFGNKKGEKKKEEGEMDGARSVSGLLLDDDRRIWPRLSRAADMR
ncbi:MAG: signal peptidase I [Nitrososphaerales archaeon]